MERSEDLLSESCPRYSRETLFSIVKHRLSPLNYLTLVPFITTRTIDAIRHQATLTNNLETQIPLSIP